MIFSNRPGHARGRGRGAGPGARSAAVLLAAALLVAAAAVPAGAFPDFELSLYAAVERGSPPAEGLLRFIRMVEDRLHDRVEVVFYPFSMAAHEAVADVHAGVLDMVLAPLPAFAAYVPTVHTWGLPYLFEDSRHVEAVVNGLVGRGFLQGLERAGLMGVALWDGGFRHLGTVDRPVRTVEDVEGLKLAVHSPGDAKVWEMLGAEPVSVPWSDVGSRLRAGHVDAVMATPYEMRSAGLQGALGHYSFVGYGWAGYMLAVNPWRWKDLPVSVRQTIQEAAVEVGRWVARRWEQLHEEAAAALEKEGIHLEKEPDTAAFRERVQELFADLREEPWFNSRLVNDIRAARPEGDG